jgi:hypothetical protein
MTGSFCFREEGLSEANTILCYRAITELRKLALGLSVLQI